MNQQKHNFSEKSKINVFHQGDWCLGNFEIGKLLGVGNFGSVYLAREKTSKYIIALKIIEKKSITNNISLIREIEIQSNLSHPNIPKIHGFFSDHTNLYIILDYCPGQELYSLLCKMKKFREQRAAKYIYQLINVLIYMHSQNVIHRDLKLENIMENQGKISIIDFGLSVITEDYRNSLVGTLDYMSPEIIKGEQYSKAIDIWALGILTFEMCHGLPPFFDENEGITKSNIEEKFVVFPKRMSEEAKDFIRIILVDNDKRPSLDTLINHRWIKLHNKL